MDIRRFLVSSVAAFAMAAHVAADTYTADGWTYKVDGEEIVVVNGTRRLWSAYASLGAGSTTVSALESGSASGAVAIPSTLPFPARRRSELLLQGVDPASIPSDLPVKALNNYAFLNNAGIVSVSFPDSMERIGNYAFYGCTGIEEVAIGKNVKKIGTAAFLGCTGIAKVDLGENVEEIGMSAFRGCTALQSVEVPHSVRKLGSHAFAESGIARVYVHSPRTEIGADAFAACPDLSSARIPYFFYREGALAVYEAYFNGSTNILVEVDVGKRRAKIEYFHLITFDAGALDGLVLQEDWPEPRECRPAPAPAECHLEVNRWTEDGWPEGVGADRIETLGEALARGGCDCGRSHADLPHPFLKEDGGFSEWGDADAAEFAGWYDSPDGELVDIGLDWKPHDDETYYGRWWCTVRTRAAGADGADLAVGDQCWVNPAEEKKVVSGTRLTLSAAAGADLAFAGWHLDGAPLVFGSDYRNLYKTITVKRLDATYEARFVSKKSVGLPSVDETKFEQTIMHPESLFFSYPLCLWEEDGTCSCETNDIWCCCCPQSRRFIFWKDPSGKYTADESAFIDTQTFAKLCTVVNIDSATLPELSVKARSLPAGFSLERGTHGENGYVLKGITREPGCYPIEMTLSNSATSVVQTVWLRFPNWTNEVFTAAGLQDVYKLSGKAGEWDFHPVAYPVKSAGWNLTVAGLPDGMRYNAAKNDIEGSPKKSGIYTPVFTAKKGSDTVKASCTVIVSLPVLTVEKSGNGKGTVTGEDKSGKWEKEFIPGTKVPLNAVPGKGCIFAGWYADGVPANKADVLGFDVDWRIASVSITMPETNLVLTARFASIASLSPVGICEIPDQTLTEGGTFEDGTFDLGEYIESAAFPKVTVKGLPPGIVFDAKTLLLSGKCVKPGIYTVVVSASASWAKGTAVRKFDIIVPNIRWGLDGIALDFEDSYLLPGGVPPSLHNEFAALEQDGWKLTIAGLPSGVKLDSRNKALSGTATKQGRFTVTFTAKRGKETRLCTSTFIVEFPELSVLVEELNPGSGASGKATGGGFYPAGKKVSLKAVPDKGCVFAGWFDEAGMIVSKQASLQVVTEVANRVFTAKFATVAEDAASLAFHACFTGCFDRCGDQYPCVDPCGICGSTFDPLDCAPFEDGTNITLTCGVAVEWRFAPDAITPATAKVSGLPAGLKMSLDKNSGAYIVSGVPTTPSKKDKNGEYIPSKTVFTVTTAGKSTAKYNLNIVVEPLPAWAVGVFEGPVYGCYDCIGHCCSEPPDTRRIVGPVASFTVSANGRITCKFPPVVSREADISTLSAVSFDCYDAEAGILTARLSGKVGGVVVENTVILERDAVDGSDRGFVDMAYATDSIGLGGMHYGLEGWSGVRNMWKEEPWKKQAAAFAKAKALKLELPGTDGETPLEVKFSAGGKATVKYGRASASTVLIPVEKDGAVLYSIPVFLYFGAEADPVSRGIEIILEWNGAGFELVEIVDPLYAP